VHVRAAALASWLLALGVLAQLAQLSGCKDPPAVLAELVAASGPVERAARQAADQPQGWGSAALGTRFFLGDAARTGDGTAQLQLGDGQRLDMEAHTVLRFGQRADAAAGNATGKRQLLVELGAIEIAGDGDYPFDLGEISVERNGGVRITAAAAGSRVQLLVGQASIRTSGGALTKLEPGVAVDFSEIEIRSLPRDAAARPDAAATPDAGGAIDASADAAAAGQGDVVVDLSGAIEIRRAGEKAWKPAPLDTRALEPGAQLRVVKGTATLGNGTLTVELSRGGVVAVGPQAGLALLGGGAAVRAAPDRGGTLALPGGGLSFPIQPRGASAEVAAGSRDSRVRVTAGTAALLGRESRLEMRRGESALLARTGALRVLVVVPEVHDVAITAGESPTIHDGKGAAAVQFRFGEKCPNGGVVELDRSSSFRSPAVSAGEGSANLLVAAGSYSYRLRCDEGGRDGRAVASGRLSVVRDSGRRPLPPAPPPFQLDADGRTYRVGYQGAIPTMNVVWKGATGSGFTLRVAHAGKDQSFSSSDPFYSIPGARLAEGTYTVWFEKSGARSKVSTLIIDFDNTAPAVYIDRPDDGAVWPSGELEVAGAVLPGWSVSVDGVALPLDKQRRFRASVPVPAGALPILVSHPQRGVHYYLRRRR
jgi:hypothetical protein